MISLWIGDRIYEICSRAKDFGCKKKACVNLRKSENENFMAYFETTKESSPYVQGLSGSGPTQLSQSGNYAGSLAGSGYVKPLVSSQESYSQPAPGSPFMILEHGSNDPNQQFQTPPFLGTGDWPA